MAAMGCSRPVPGMASEMPEQQCVCVAIQIADVRILHRTRSDLRKTLGPGVQLDDREPDGAASCDGGLCLCTVDLERVAQRCGRKLFASEDPAHYQWLITHVH